MKVNYIKIDCLSRVRWKSHARFSGGESLRKPTYPNYGFDSHCPLQSFNSLPPSCFFEPPSFLEKQIKVFNFSSLFAAFFKKAAKRGSMCSIKSFLFSLLKKENSQKKRETSKTNTWSYTLVDKFLPFYFRRKVLSNIFYLIR